MRARVAAALALLVIAEGCESILGIEDHQLASGTDAGASAGGDGNELPTNGPGAGNEGGGTGGAPGDATSGAVADALSGPVDATSPSPDAASGSADATVEASSSTEGDGGISPQQSCAPGGAGLTDCHTGASGLESCCTSLEVEGGTFYRTYDPVTDSGVIVAADGGPTGLADTATVSGFRLDKYDVTVARFRQFVGAWNGGAGWRPQGGAGKHTHLNGGQGLASVTSPGTYETGWLASDGANIAPTDNNLACSGYSTWTTAVGGNENLPINCITWFEAYAFCIWDGGFLPSEAEWGYAAAGGGEQREYPWGSTPPGTANQYAIYDCLYPTGSQNCRGTANVAPVGTPDLGAGRWGQVDLVGNLSKWNVDWYVSNYQDPCVDCAFLMYVFEFRVLRGGSYADYAPHLVSSYRDNTPPTFRSDFLGARCARVP